MTCDGGRTWDLLCQCPNPLPASDTGRERKPELLRREKHGREATADTYRVQGTHPQDITVGPGPRAENPLERRFGAVTEGRRRLCRAVGPEADIRLGSYSTYVHLVKSLKPLLSAALLGQMGQSHELALAADAFFGDCGVALRLENPRARCIETPNAVCVTLTDRQVHH